jgi:hypothetical protein
VRLSVLLTLVFSFSVNAHEIQSISQHINLRKQNETGVQQSLAGRIRYSKNLDIGLQGTYLERFGLYEKQAGALIGVRPDDRWMFELRYVQGMGNEILPERQTTLTSYYDLGEGLSPFLFYRDNRYSLTTVHSFNLGVEIEKIPHFIFIPMVMKGKATFHSPAKTDDIFSYGLRISYYEENKFSFSIFGAKGREASQGIVGRSTVLIDTLSGGASFAWFFQPDFKSELIFDHTDFDQLKTEFHTTTLNLTWMF